MSVLQRKLSLLATLAMGVPLSLVGCGSEGEVGPQGPAGPTGAAGATGPAGATGATGQAGTDGTAGPTGPTGPTGDPGTDWPGPVPEQYTAADGILGGAAYSAWFEAAAGGSGSAGISVQADYVRCKACHGWDGLGSAGSYANRTGQSSGTASRPDVSSVNLRATAISASYEQLYDLVSRPGARPLDARDNAHPDYSDALTATQTWNLVKFMREEWVAPGVLYDLTVTGAAMHWDYSTNPATLVRPTLTYSNIGKDGNAGNGQTVYTAKCVLCHGADGKMIALDGAAYTGVGSFVRAKPNEAWFKIKFGNGGLMVPGLVTSTTELKDLYKALSSSIAFPN